MKYTQKDKIIKTQEKFYYFGVGFCADFTHFMVYN